MSLRISRLCLIVVLGTAACNSRPPLANAHPSADALARAVLDALARSDRQALEAVALTEQEFRDRVWPDLPAARPERNLPFSYVWGDLRQKSQVGLARTLATHGGRRYELVGVRFEGPSTRYSQSEVHRATVLTVRDAQGAGQDVRLFGSSIEGDGAWKVFSYVLD
jgi:hypothetical protein